MTTIDSYLRANAERFEDELFDFLRIPSVSAAPDHRAEVAAAADWLVERFLRMGFAAELIPTAGHPLVLAESPRSDAAATVLVYGHYDVQPPEPLEKWTTPPFEPVRREGAVYARGASDDKGQIFTHIASAGAWGEVEGGLPVNLKFLIEGEEEIGSRSLEAFVRENPRRLACDCVVISDGSQFAPNRPAITCGLRGIAYYELRLTGPQRDLHSGSFGGSLVNPAVALAQMLAALIDQNGRVNIPGFYDDVLELDEQQRRDLADLPFDESAYMQELGVDALWGEAGYTTLERRWTRPTFDVCGLTAGYQGDGAKTIIPATASAKLSFRLVPQQDPEKITTALHDILAKRCPPGISMQLIDLQGSPAVTVPPQSPYLRAAARAVEAAFGTPPLYTREGGSIPVVSTFAQALDADILLLGWGQSDDNTHSPDEKFSLCDFHRGILASARLWEELSRVEKQ